MQTTDPARVRPPLTRPREGRRVAGVAAGVARWCNLDPNVVRLAFGVLTFANGIGIVLYAIGWLVLPHDGDPASRLQRALRPSGRWDAVQLVALAVVVIPTVILARELGIGAPDRVLGPLVLAGVGGALVWGRLRPDGASAGAGTVAGVERPGADAAATTHSSAAVAALFGGTRGPAAVARVVLGSVLVIMGASVFLVANTTATAARQAVSAIVVFAVGIGLVFGPWLWRLANDLAEERRERVRSQERAELAAHLHDSVLHTLALVRRSADDPRRVVSLASRQERELRSWLSGRPSQPTSSVGAALDALVGQVETDHGVPIEIVKVGDCPLDAPLEAMLAAAREAMVNAAQHSGARSIDVYAEIDERRALVFVRDRGVGFDPERMSPDRHGVRDSIVGRMCRHGGEATIRSSTGAGTEVRLELARTVSA
jgi:signal transduction histidine kinase/phage shock protein PspC (stress-responsive transcriptional regulator)